MDFLQGRVAEVFLQERQQAVAQMREVGRGVGVAGAGAVLAPQRIAASVMADSSAPMATDQNAPVGVTACFVSWSAVRGTSVEVAIKHYRRARVGSIIDPNSQLTKHASTPLLTAHCSLVVVQTSLSFSPDGSRSYFLLDNGPRPTHYVDGQPLDLGGLQAIPWVDGVPGNPARAFVAFSPDGRHCAVLAREEANTGGRKWVVVDGRRLHPVAADYRWPPLFTPDGRHLFWAGYEPGERANGRWGMDWVVYANGRTVARLDYQNPLGQELNGKAGTWRIHEDGTLQILAPGAEGLVRHTVRSDAFDPQGVAGRGRGRQRGLSRPDGGVAAAPSARRVGERRTVVRRLLAGTWSEAGRVVQLGRKVSRVTLIPEDGCGFGHGIVGGDRMSAGRSVVRDSGNSVVSGRRGSGGEEAKG